MLLIARLGLGGGSMLALLAVLADQPATVSVHCSMPDTNGVPRSWNISLNESLGTADVSVADGEPYRLSATYFPETVRFYLRGMRLDLSRVDLKIARYSGGESKPPNVHQCQIARPVQRKF